MISLVDRDRQWFKAHVGLHLGETSRDVAFCAHAILKPAELLIVPDATKDGRFADNPLVTGEPYIRFYAGAPLVDPDGPVPGTLSVLDRLPRALRAEQERALAALGRVVVRLLEGRRQLLELRWNTDGEKPGEAAPPPPPAERAGPPRFLLYSHDG